MSEDKNVALLRDLSKHVQLLNKFDEHASVQIKCVENRYEDDDSQKIDSREGIYKIQNLLIKNLIKAEVILRILKNLKKF